MRIAVFGANGATGRYLIRQALAHADESGAEGLGADELVVLLRDPVSFPFADDRLRIVRGDVRDSAAVGEVVSGADAVLSSIGTPFSREPIDIYSAAATTIIDAMRETGVRRIAVTSSTAVAPHEPTEGWFFERVLQPMVVNGIGRTTYDDMRRMEAIVGESGLDWTIARASGLFPAAAPTAYRVAAGHVAGRFTSRPDLADFLLRQARDTTWIGARPEVHTDQDTPSLVRVIWNEGIRHAPDPILGDATGTGAATAAAATGAAATVPRRSGGAAAS